MHFNFANLPYIIKTKLGQVLDIDVPYYDIFMARYKSDISLKIKIIFTKVRYTFMFIRINFVINILSLSR